MSQFEYFSRQTHLRDKRFKSFSWSGRGNEKDKSGGVLEEFDTFVAAFG